MKPSVFFSALEPLREVPEVCDVCHLDPPALSYQFATPGDGGEPEEQQGFCCRWCAAELLHKLERAGAQRRAREEAAPRVDEFDIIDSSEPELAVSIH